MVKYCCICKGKWTSDTDRSFFCFPKREEILKEWLRVIPTVKQVKSHLRVCHKHFLATEYRQVSGKVLLNKNAIPSMYLQPKLISIANYLELEEYRLNVNMEKSSENINIEESQEDNIGDLPDTLAKKKRKTEEVQISPDVKDVATQVSPGQFPPCIREQKLMHKNNILRKRLYRRDKKLSNMTDLLKRLKRARNSSDELEELLLKHFSGLKLDILQNELHNYNKKFKRSYSDEMKMFAATLYCYSPRAYNFVREHLSLPHEVTLRRHVAEFSSKADADETVSSGVETVKHAVESGLNKAQNSIGTVVNSIGNTMHSTKEHATDAVEHIDSAIEDAAHKTHETMDDAISDAKTVLVGEEDRAKDIDTLSTTVTLAKEDDMKHEFGEPIEEVESHVVEVLHVEDIEHNAEVQEETATLKVKKEE